MKPTVLETFKAFLVDASDRDVHFAWGCCYIKGNSYAVGERCKWKKAT